MGWSWAAVAPQTGCGRPHLPRLRQAASRPGPCPASSSGPLPFRVTLPGILPHDSLPGCLLLVTQAGLSPKVPSSEKPSLITLANDHYLKSLYPSLVHAVPLPQQNGRPGSALPRLCRKDSTRPCGHLLMDRMNK